VLQPSPAAGMASPAKGASGLAEQVSRSLDLDLS
jgi:hypothetical protein